MRGKPKYKIDDILSFYIDDELITGSVYTVDKYGVFEDNTDVHYDIYSKDTNTLYKHIREDKVLYNKHG